MSEEDFERTWLKKFSRCLGEIAGEEIRKEILNTIKFHLGLKRGFIKFTNRELTQLCRICRKVYGGTPVESIDMHHLVKSIVLSSPRILWIAMSVMISRPS